MLETFNLLDDMARIEAIVFDIENDLHKADLPMEKHAELVARQLYLLRHLRVASAIVKANIVHFDTNAESRRTTTATEKLKEMTLKDATYDSFTLKSKAMKRINQGINTNRLNSIPKLS